MTDYLFPTKAAEEAAIARFAVTVARRVRISFANEWGMPLADAPATDISDACRDEAHDVLVAFGRSHPGHDVVDLLLMDVTEAATEALL